MLHEYIHRERCIEGDYKRMPHQVHIQKAGMHALFSAERKTVVSKSCM